MHLDESKPTFFAYYFFDILAIAAMLVCLVLNFWILIAVGISYVTIARGSSTSVEKMDGGGFAVGIAVIVALFCNPILYFGTLVPVCLWMFYSPGYKRQFGSDITSL